MSLSNPTSPDVAIQSPLTTFNEVKTADATARVQLDGVYGLTETDFESFTNAAGTVSSSGPLLVCTTGTTAGAYGVIRTITGAFAQLQAGVAGDIDTAFVPQTSWNVDELDGSGPGGMTIDPTKLNVYEIDLSYLGAGAIPFYVMTPKGKLALVHVIEYPNSASTPHMKDPSLRLGWAVASLGSTTNLTVSGASAAGFVQGPLIPLRDPVGFSTTFTATTTEAAWLLIRNRIEYANRVNHRELLPLVAAITNETANRIVRVRFVVNPTLSATANWLYVNQANSSTEYAIGTGITVSGGRQVGAFAAATQQELNFRDADLRLEPGDVLAICVQTASSTAVVDASLNWLEE